VLGWDEGGDDVDFCRDHEGHLSIFLEVREGRGHERRGFIESIAIVGRGSLSRAKIMNYLQKKKKARKLRR